ncbi:DNA-binding protein [Anaeromicropila populeti]
MMYYVYKSFFRYRRSFYLYPNILSVKAASEKWIISERQIQKLCEDNRIVGTLKFDRAWMIPKDVEKPADGRHSLKK